MGEQVESAPVVTHQSRPRTASNGADSALEAQTTGPVHPREGWPSWRWPGIMVLFCINFILVGYDVSNIANIQAPIFEAFGHTELLPWVALGYTCINASVIPLVRKLLVICDLRYQIAAYSSLLFVGAAVSGSAQTMNAVIIGRCITGLGGAGLYQVFFVYNVILTTSKEASRTQGLVAATWAIGLLMGPIIGGAIAQNAHMTWRWAIYINLPLVGIIPLLTFVFLPPKHLGQGQTILATLAEIDWTGFVLHCSGLIFLCACLIFSGSTWVWHSRSAIAAWIVVGLILITYLRQQMYAVFTTPARRIFPIDLLADRAVLLVGIATSACGASYGVTLYYTPLFFAFTRGDSPLNAAVHLLPFIGTFIGFCLLVGAVLPIVRMYTPFYMLGGALMTIGGGLATTISPTTPQSRVMGYDALIGAGVGMLFALGAVVMPQRQPAERKFDVTTVFISFQLCGIAISLATAGCIYQNVGFGLLSKAIGGLPGATPDAIRQALAGVDSKMLGQVPQPIVAEIVAAVTIVIARLNYMVVAAGCLAFACGCLMDFERLPFDHNTGTEVTAVGNADVVTEKVVNA